MEDSILNSTKKILNIPENYTAFDLDITMHINDVFAVLHQIGIGPEDGFEIEDASAKWSDLTLDKFQLNMVRSYVYLKVRMAFDPPATSFHIEAMNKQIEEKEFRLSVNREHTVVPVYPVPEVEIV